MTPAPKEIRVVREGRLSAIHPVVASAGTVRVVDAAMYAGARACTGQGDASRICVRGGITAEGRSAR